MQQNQHGLNYGLTATINIFDGFNQTRKERNAKIQIDNANISAKQVQLNIEAQVNSLYASYLSGLDLNGFRAGKRDDSKEKPRYIARKI
jgi:outer membrane protein